MKRLVALTSMLVLAGSVGGTTLLASSEATGAGAADPSFAPSGPVPTGLGPCSVATDNLDGDGDPDLAVTNCGSDDLVVLLGDGAGSFRRAAGSPITVGRTPVSVAAADFDGDGKIDLAVANHGSKDVTVLLGDGAGAFRAAPGSPVRVAGAAVEVIAADLNADGNPDLVVPASPKRVAILVGDGSGRFAPAPGSPVAIGGGRYGPTSGAVADFNRDGKPDLAVAKGESPGISILLGNGAGGFGAARTILARTHAETLTVADLSRDGNADLAVASPDPNGGQVRIALGNRMGGFRLVGSPIAIRYPGDLATADMNGDEKLDLAVASQGNEVRVLLGNGAGGFRPATESPFALPEPPFFSSYPLGIVAADLNADGKTDLAMPVNQGLNHGSGEGVTILWQTPSTPAAVSGGALPGRRHAVFSTRGGIGNLAVDGNRVAVTTSKSKGRCGLRVVVWNVLGRKSRSFKTDEGCGESIRGYSVDQLALNGGQVAWIGSTGGNDLELHLRVAKLSGRAAKEIDFVTSSDDGRGEWVGQLLGGGPLLAYNRWAVVCDDSGEGCPPGELRLKSEKLVRISAGRGVVVKRGAGSYPLGAVGGGRMAVESEGAVTVLAPSGSPVATVPAVEGNPPRAVALSKTLLVVARTFTLDLYDPETGAEAKSLPLGPAAALQLAGVNSKLALLWGRRRLVLVRLSDGKLISFPLRPGMAKRSDARLGAAGLFYAYNALRGPAKGRIVFEATAKLLARF